MATKTKTTTASRDVTTELAYLTRALKAPTLRRSRRPARRTSPCRDVELRGVPGGVPAARSVRP